MHLLVVDDNPSILEILETFIESLTDHTVETALSVADALDLLARPEATAFDCFLLDIQMPGTDGIELCKILRGRPDHKHTPILMLTAMSEKSYIDQAFKAGASDYITKPFDVVQLRGRLGLVDSLLAGRKKQSHAPNLAKSNADADAGKKSLALYEPYWVQDVDGVIEYFALENYVSLLSSKRLFESAVFAFSIRGIEDLYENTSPSEYECLITGVSEAISSCLETHQFLASYAGSGSFVCIVEDGWQPDPKVLMHRVNMTLSLMELSFDDGTRMNIEVSSGDIIRMERTSGDKAVDALAAAFDSAEKASGSHAINLENIRYSKQSA